MKRIYLHSTDIINKEKRLLIERSNYDLRFLYSSEKDNYLKYIVDQTSDCNICLDVGKSTREYFPELKCKKVETLDINEFDDYPDIVADLCLPFPEDFIGRYDAIIALAILEHVYNPFLAVENLYKLLNANGQLFLYVPFLYRYHAPDDLQFQDYFRFSRDAIAILLHEFSAITIYPVRGRISTIAALLPGWKNVIEKNFGTWANRLLDKLSTDKTNFVQASGYYVHCRK